jgi:hypothetical protein
VGQTRTNKDVLKDEKDARDGSGVTGGVTRTNKDAKDGRTTEDDLRTLWD